MIDNAPKVGFCLNPYSTGSNSITKKAAEEQAAQVLILILLEVTQFMLRLSLTKSSDLS